MQVRIENLYSGLSHVVEGSPAHVEAELLRLYPFLRSEDPDDAGDIDSLVEELNAQQALQAEVVGDQPLRKAEPRGNLSNDDLTVAAAMLGHRPSLDKALEAARFLAGAQPPEAGRMRQALWEADGDVEEAALVACGLEPSQANLKALRSVQGLSQQPKPKPQPAELPGGDVQAGDPDAQDAAEEVERAFRDQFVLPVALGGKHSKGSLLARDQDSGRVWLLKPGSGGQTPAAGAREELASQSRREAAFWHVADAWGLGGFFPEAELLLIGNREYAAIHLLPWSFETLDKANKDDPNRGRSVLQPLLKNGTLHRWAVLDYVLGNPDRHAQNLMVRGDEVRLIDHGSAMAGEGFDPAGDKYSFTPYYLRAWAPGKWSKLDVAARLKAMPRLGREAEEELRKWLLDLRGEELDRVLGRYGVAPGPAKARLARLQAGAKQEAADLAVNRAWVET